MSGNTKRNLVVGTMAVLVCAAVGLNWKYSTQEALQQAEETGTKILGEATLVSGQEGTELAEDTVYEGDDYFASARLTRQQARDNAISMLKEAERRGTAPFLSLRMPPSRRMRTKRWQTRRRRVFRCWRPTR